MLAGPILHRRSSWAGRLRDPPRRRVRRFTDVIGATSGELDLRDRPAVFDWLHGQRPGAVVRRRLLIRPRHDRPLAGQRTQLLSWEETVRLDLHYVENWSLALDLTIMWTFGAVARGRGAY